MLRELSQVSSLHEFVYLYIVILAMLSITLSIAVFAASTAAQSLVEATANFSQLSDFRKLLQAFPSLEPQPNNTASKYNVLAPSNDAFARYLETTGTAVQNLPVDVLTNIFLYHTLDGQPFDKLNDEGDVLANSELKADIYNHRNGSEGQVVFVTKNQAATDNTPATAVLESGAGKKVNLSLVNDEWDAGSFQIVDG
jgi:hypothetical protein